MKKSKLLVLSLLAVSAISLTSCGEVGPKGDKGDPGTPGEKGDTGTPGKDGVNGTDGTSVLNGEGAPKDTLGSDGDSYIDYSSFDYYVKENGKWVKKGNIKGEKGNDGEQGPKGDTGAKGEKGDTGSSGSTGSRGDKGETAWSNTILKSEHGYVVPSVGSATTKTQFRFTMIGESTTYKGSFLSLVSNGKEEKYYPKDFKVDEKGNYYYLATMVDGGFVVSAKFDEPKLSVTITESTGGTVAVDDTRSVFFSGEKIKLKITPDSANKYSFKGLKIGKDTVDASKATSNSDGTYTYEVTMGSASLTIQGLFTQSIAEGFTYSPDEKTYEISSAAGLKAFRDQVNALCSIDNNGKATIDGSKSNIFKGTTIKLTKDIDLNGESWTPIRYPHAHNEGFTFDGNNKTISNYKYISITEKYVGLFGQADRCTIQNLNVKNVEMKGLGYVAAIVGFGAYKVTIKDCSVENATITSTYSPNTSNTPPYDDADKAGAIIGKATSDGNDKVSITGCTAKDVTIRGYRDIGGIVGHAETDSTSSKVTIKGNKLAGTIKLINDRTYDYNTYGDTDSSYDIGEFVGEQYKRAEGTFDVGENTKEDDAKVIITILYTDGFSYDVANKQYEISSVEGLKYFRDHAKEVKFQTKVVLTKNLDLNGEEWKPIEWVNFGNAIFDGQNHTISNFKVTQPIKDFENSYCAGFFGKLVGKVMNLTIDNVEISGLEYVGGIVGDGENAMIENCSVTNSTIKGGFFPDSNNTGWKGNNNVGGIVGYALNSLNGEFTIYVKNCTVYNCEITGYRNTGGLIGTRNRLENDTTLKCEVTGNKVIDTKIFRDKEEGKNYNSLKYDGDENIKEIIGRELASEHRYENNEIKNVTIQDKVVK